MVAMVPRKFQNNIPENKVPDKSTSFLWFDLLIFGFLLSLGYLFCMNSLMREFLGTPPSSPWEPGPDQGFSIRLNTVACLEVNLQVSVKLLEIILINSHYINKDKRNLLVLHP